MTRVSELPIAPLEFVLRDLETARFRMRRRVKETMHAAEVSAREENERAMYTLTLVSLDLQLCRLRGLARAHGVRSDWALRLRPVLRYRRTPRADVAKREKPLQRVNAEWDVNAPNDRDARFREMIEDL